MERDVYLRAVRGSLTWIRCVQIWRSVMMRPLLLFHDSSTRLHRFLATALIVALPCALLTFPVAAQRNARVLHRNLAELVSDAHTIVAGRVLSVKGEPHPQYSNVQTVVVTLEVSEVFKGQSGSQFTFRLFVSDVQDVETNLDYKAGEEVLLMMTRPSQIGFSSPAGLEQGRFRVRLDAQGNRTLVNGFNNAGLFRNISQKAPQLAAQLGVSARQTLAQHRSGPIAYDQLREMILNLKSTP